MEENVTINQTQVRPAQDHTQDLQDGTQSKGCVQRGRWVPVIGVLLVETRQDVVGREHPRVDTR